MRRNIVLIGFMGAGKSAVGRALAEVLGYTFHDIDDIVVREAGGRSVPELWEAEGEEGFRAREYHAVLSATAGDDRVIACGGGTIVQPRCYAPLRNAGTIVYLRAAPSVLRARVADGAGRPLLRDPAAFDTLLAEREPQYEAVADTVVETDDRTAEQVADEILTRVR